MVEDVNKVFGSPLQSPSEEFLDRVHDGGVQSFFLSNGAPLPPKVKKAEGIYYWDVEGRQYIDAASGPIAVNVGHGNRRVLDAITAQANEVTFAFPLSFRSEANLRFSKALLDASGPGFDHVYVTSGGSEAVETCMKFARTYAVRKGETSRRLFISLNPSYHGATLGAMSLTGDEAMEELFGAISHPAPKVPAPLTYRLPDNETAQSYAHRCVAALRSRIESLGPENVLAFVMEPITGLSSGANVAPDSYYREVRQICSEYGIILIYDEVLSGSGRTGKFLACQHWSEARPDLIALSKGISSGYVPLGAMLAPDDMVELVAQSGGFPHAQTYTTTPLACAAGAAIMQEISDRYLVANAQAMGDLLKSELDQITHTSPIIGDVRGRGLLLALEIVADKDSKDMLPQSVNSPARIGQIAMEEGLVLYPRRTNGGKFGDWIMVTPPLIVDANQVGEISSRLARTLDRYTDELVRQRHI